MDNLKELANKRNESARKRHIDFLKDYYNKGIVDAAIAYADSQIQQLHLFPHDSVLADMAKEKAAELGQKVIIDFIDLQKEVDNQELFEALTLSYVHGAAFSLENPNISKTPEPATDYVLSKDFAFIFDFGDNDFGVYIESAAQEYCKEYNSLLRNIEMDPDIDLYKQGIEYMENQNNVRELMKAAFMGEYLSCAIDRCWIGRETRETEYNAMNSVNNALELANSYFNFEANEGHKYDGQVNWKFGTWDEVSKFGLEKYKGLQGKEDLERANGDFTKYWLNGEVLIVRIVNGKLVAEVH